AKLKAQYGTLLEDIDKHYQLVFTDAKREIWFNNLYSGIRTLQLARIINGYQNSFANYPASQHNELFNINLGKIKEQLDALYENYNVVVDKYIAKHQFTWGYGLSGVNSIETIQNKKFSNSEAAENYIADLIDQSPLHAKERLYNEVLKDAATFLSFNDPLLALQKEFNEELVVFSQELTRREGILNKLMADYVAVKEIFQDRDFVPDANSTLRLTFGHIKGYSPADATFMAPFTTVRGLIEKGNSGDPEFAYPQAIKNAWLSKNFGAYYKEEIDDVPVNILYNMDTTGGNSGSPIMNAYGDLIGVNFDRAYDATINDFAWNESYSRSIGVDIRYVLWIADKIDNAQFILKEMGI